MVSVCTVPARGGRLCARFGGYKTINRIPFVIFTHGIDHYFMDTPYWGLSDPSLFVQDTINSFMPGGLFDQCRSSGPFKLMKITLSSSINSQKI